jgi:geranylgeranyl diphosphate synthase type I
MNTFKDFSAANILLIDEYISSFYNEKINSSEFEFISQYYETIKEYCCRKGKRIRPLLFLLSAFGYGLKHKNQKEFIKVAAALEIMHSFLLVQDDIIDNSNIRRGLNALHIELSEKLNLESKSKKTQKNKKAESMAFVLADIMFSNALEMIASSNICNKSKERYLKIFSATYEKTAWGQVSDILNSGNISDDSSKIEKNISEMKTAYYTIYYPMLMGYSIVNEPNLQETAALKEFCIPLGIAFQLRDDLLGVFGNESNTGKSSDSDLEEGKLTLLIKNCFESLSLDKKNKFKNLFVLPHKSKSDIEEIKKIIIESGAYSTTISQFKEDINLAKNNINALSISKQYKVILLEFVCYIENIKSAGL